MPQVPYFAATSSLAHASPESPAVPTRLEMGTERAAPHSYEPEERPLLLLLLIPLSGGVCVAAGWGEPRGIAPAPLVAKHELVFYWYGRRCYTARRYTTRNPAWDRRPEKEMTWNAQGMVIVAPVRSGPHLQREYRRPPSEWRMMGSPSSRRCRDSWWTQGGHHIII
jgi:hypothetical protein